MKILAIDLSSARGGIAFTNGESSPVVREFPNDRKHSGLFFDHLSDVWKSNPPPDLIAVGLGPGSYAGTRIAISAAIGLKTACGAPLVGVSSICALTKRGGEYRVIGDAKRQSFFFALVNNGRCVEGPALFDEAALREKLAERNDLPLFATEALPAFAVTVQYPSAIILATLATSQSADANPIEPIYLRAPHITTSTKPLLGSRIA
jgi:tRNA threonylcarbamoyladenosine biosynthesis protein TsaB